jgi:hypothetical protein
VVEVDSREDAALACSAVLTQPLNSSPGCCTVPWLRKWSPTAATQKSTAIQKPKWKPMANQEFTATQRNTAMLEPTLPTEQWEKSLHVLSWLETVNATNEEVSELDSLQKCLAEVLAKGVSPQEICRCFESTIHKADLTKRAVDNGGAVKAGESLRFTVEEIVACAYLLVHTDCGISYNDFKNLFNSLVLLREAIARGFTDDATAAHIKSWDFLFKDSATIVTWLLKFSPGKKVPSELRELLKKMPAENDAWLKELIAEAEEKMLPLYDNGENRRVVKARKGDTLGLLQFTVEKCVDCAYVLANRPTGSEDVINLERFNNYFDCLVKLRMLIVRKYPRDADVLAKLKRWNFLFKDSTTIVTWLRELSSSGEVPSKLQKYLKTIPASEVPCLLAPAKV